MKLERFGWSQCGGGGWGGRATFFGRLLRCGHGTCSRTTHGLSPAMLESGGERPPPAWQSHTAPVLESLRRIRYRAGVSIRPTGPGAMCAQLDISRVLHCPCMGATSVQETIADQSPGSPTQAAAKIRTNDNAHGSMSRGPWEDSSTIAVHVQAGLCLSQEPPCPHRRSGVCGASPHACIMR